MTDHNQKAIEVEAEVERLMYKNKQLEGLDDESLQKFELFADGDSEIWKRGYIAGRSKTDEEKDKRIGELEEALRELVNDWEGEEPFKDEPVYKQDTEHNFGYWSPAAKMVKAELIFKAKQLLKS